MKIGIIGCSHSAGVSEQGWLRKAGGFNAWHKKGFPQLFAKRYPQHEWHLFASPGGGQNNMEAALRTCLIEDYDMVILQFTTQRQMFPVTINRKSKKRDGKFDSWFGRETRGNFTLHQQNVKSLSIKNYVHERKCVQVGAHWDPRMEHIFNKNTDDEVKVNTEEMPKVVLDMLIDNEYFNQMAETFYNCRNMYKKLFKHFYSILWVPTYKNGPQHSDQAVITVEGKVPQFVEDFLTGQKLREETDWNITVYDWLVKHYMDTKNLDKLDANRLVFHEYKNHKGHLGAVGQEIVFEKMLLSHKEFKEALDAS